MFWFDSCNISLSIKSARHFLFNSSKKNVRKVAQRAAHTDKRTDFRKQTRINKWESTTDRLEYINENLQ